MPVLIKICGLTRAEDLERVRDAGADFFGFIGYRPSPRFVPLEQAARLGADLPAERRVYVDVAPPAATLGAALEAGFGSFQIHFESGTPEDAIDDWRRTVGTDRLWLAPRLKPGEPFDPRWLPLAGAFLIDSYDPARIGGTGRTGDWASFRALRERHPGKRWILAGGIGPGNLRAALQATGAEHLDVNSGIESEPGIKDPGKIRRLFAERGE